MNKCYRLVFNRCSGVWQAVAENVSGHGRGGYKLMAAAALVAAMPLAQAQVTDPMGLTDLGTLSTATSSTAAAISADGTTVVGKSGADAFYWTQSDGMKALHANTTGATAPPSGIVKFEALGVNSDGTVIVGKMVPGVGGDAAFRWTEAGGWEDLGTLETGTLAPQSTATAYGVNGDGTVVVGDALNDSLEMQAFRWVEGSGMHQLFTEVDRAGTNETAGISAGNAVNKAGNVVVGTYYDGSNTSAFRWVEGTTANTGVATDLGALDKSGTWSSGALGVNAAGDVVVGYSQAGSTFEAFRWTTTDGMVGLGTVSGYTDSWANATNSTGNVVVGDVFTLGATDAQGFRWELGTGMQTVEQWLESSGVDISALTDTTVAATGVSADGSIVVGLLSNGQAYLARGTAGMINLDAFNNSLGRTAASAVLAENQNDLVFHGMHGNPMQSLLKTGGSAFWTAGDFGRQDRDARKSDIVAGEIGYAHRINDAIQLNVAAGHTYSSAKTDNGGKTRVDGNFILPEMIVSVPGSGYATISGIYAKGSAKIDRGYVNTGTQTLSHGSSDTTTLGARIRFDWHEMANVGGTLLTPYVGLSYLQTTIDAYTETGGGFPVQWNKREEKATTARVGLDAAKPVSDTLKVTGRLEGVHRFENKNVGASGQIVGLGGFDFSGQKLKQNWLRVAAGLEGKMGSGIASATLNATTEGEAAAYWLAVNYRWQF